MGVCKTVHSVTRTRVTCQRATARAQEQLIGQLPAERVTPDLIFNRVVVDYAGPLQLKVGLTCRPVIVRSYVCMFVSLSVRVVHLKLVSDLMTDEICCLPETVHFMQGETDSHLE